jgi:hypothetical protein
MASASVAITPEHVRFLAAMPFCGQADVLIRTIDPWWRIVGELRTYKVSFVREIDGECPTCGCDCGEYTDTERKTIEVEARSPEAAEERAQSIMDRRELGWEFVSVEKPRPPKIKMPPEIEAAKVVEQIAAQIRWVCIFRMTRDSRSKPDRATTAQTGVVHESGGAEGNRPNSPAITQGDEQ